MNLSEEQWKVVHAQEPRVAVIGPPGTGKTRVLTERIKYLLDSGVPSEDIVAITFTNFAANEMKTRLKDTGQMFIGTMHSYAAQLLMRNGIRVDFDGMAKKGNFGELINRVLEEKLDLPQIKYLFVDEVQDLCENEFQFIWKMKYENIFLGGDSDQCIYQFKGAKPTLFTNYCKDKNTTTYILTRNFRSGQNIIEYAAFFACHITGHISVKVVGNTVQKGRIVKSDFDDALYNLYCNKNYGSWFILTRTNAELEEVSKRLENYKIPYTSFKQGDFTNEEIEQFLKNDEVKLLTIHSAKGLENDNVIVVGARGWSDEEKCIEYVAATRARNTLYWCPSVVPKQVKKKIVTSSTIAKRMTGLRWE